MPRYFFDTRDGQLVRDEEGLELAGIEVARDEATRGLADFAKDALPGSLRRELAVEVRDESDRYILRASLWFEVAALRNNRTTSGQSFPTGNGFLAGTRLC